MNAARPDVTLDPERLAERLDALPAAAGLEPLRTGREPVYLVGGAVRDLALGRAPSELDLLIEGDAAAAARTLAGGDAGAVRIFARFGTATVNVAGHAYDLATARRERYAAPGALPEVAPAGAQEDLQRRDFTVNAAALGLGGPARGRLLSVPQAQADLAAGRLRILHPDSFADDPTRLLRLARYAARLGFDAEPGTAALARTAISGGALDTVSGPRIGAELALLAAEPDPVAALGALTTMGVAGALAPGFGLTDPAVLAAALELLGADGDRVVIGLGAATLGMTATARDGLLNGLGLSAPRRDAIRAVARDSDALARALAGAVTRSEIAGAARRASPEAVALAAARDPAARSAALAWRDELRHVTLRISGDDLIAAGVPAGPRVGAGLEAARVAVLEGRAPDAAAELAEALRAALA